MIEIQCTSCQTRYRIDERILPEDTPTFKCSRCGHVFSAEPRQKPSRRASADGARAAAPAKSAPPPAADATAPPAAAEAAAAEAAAAEATAAEAPAARLRQAGGAGRRAAAQQPP